MTFEGQPEARPPARTLGWIWLVAGGVAVVVGAVTTVVMIIVFGLIAAALGGALLGVAHIRDKSRARTSRTLSGNPPPPATAPYRPPAPEPDLRGPDDAEVADDASGSSAEPAGTGAQDVSDARRAASDVEEDADDEDDDRRD